MSLCDKCHRPAIIYQKYSGMHLCSSHFDEDVHRKVRERLRKTNLFGGGSRLALGLDGGKDSSVLLYILKSFFGCRKDIEFCAIIIDEEKENTPHLQARNLARKLDVPYVIKNLPKEERPIPEDDFLKHSVSFARKMEVINAAAHEVDADILATGHNLDDEAAWILANYLAGDLNILFNISSSQENPGKIPWIKPLQRVPEKEVRLYAIGHGLYSSTMDMRLSKSTMHGKLNRLLNGFDSQHPGTKYSLLAGLEKIMRIHDGTDAGAKPLSDDAK